MTSAEVSPCQVCETPRDAHLFLRLKNCEVARCRGCGFVYLNGERSPEKSWYDTDHFDGGYLRKFDVGDIITEQMESVRKVLRRAGHSLDDVPLDAPALDVGCARGHFLRHLSQETGRTDLVGVDLSPAMTKYGREEFGLDLRAGAVEEVELPRDHFALVTMFDVLEHVARPRDVLTKLVKVLRPDGWLVLEVPSEVTAFRSLARWGYRASAGRLRVPLERLYHRWHLSYFTSPSLTRLIRSVGGENVAVMTKEAHVTRFGASNFSPPGRIAIRLVSGLDRILGTQAKLLCAFRRPE